MVANSKRFESLRLLIFWGICELFKICWSPACGGSSQSSSINCVFPERATTSRMVIPNPEKTCTNDVKHRVKHNQSIESYQTQLILMSVGRTWGASLVMFLDMRDHLLHAVEFWKQPIAQHVMIAKQCYLYTNKSLTKAFGSSSTKACTTILNMSCVRGPMTFSKAHKQAQHFKRLEVWIGKASENNEKFNLE